MFTVLFFLFSSFEIGPLPKFLHPFEKSSDFNIFLNPAIPDQDGLRASCSFSNLYSIEGLNLFSAGVRWSRKPYSISLFASQFGDNLYREILTGVSGSYSFKNQYVCLRFKPMFLSIKNYGSKAVWSFDLFGWTEITDYLGVGLAAENMISTTYGSSPNRPQINIKSHIICEPLAGTSARIGFSKAQENEIRKSFALSIDLGSIYFVGDYTDRPSEIALGFGVSVSDITPFYGVSNHPELGYTHIAFLSWSRENIERSQIRPVNSVTLAPDTIEVRIFPADLNRASKELLDRIPGIGPVLAQRIVGRRSELGAFMELEELLDITGIGESLFQKIKPYLTIGDKDGM